MVHEENWRVSLCVQNLYHPPDFPWILAATPGFQNSTVLDLSRQTTGFPVLSRSPFHLFLEIFGWLGELARDWIHGRPRVSPFYHQHWNLTQALERYHFQFDRSLSRVSLSLDVAVIGEEDELEEDVGQCLSCFESVLEVDEDPEDELDKPGTTTGTKFSVLHCIRIPFLMRCGFDHWSIHKNIRFHRKAFQATVLLACFRGLS